MYRLTYQTEASVFVQGHHSTYSSTDLTYCKTSYLFFSLTTKSQKSGILGNDTPNNMQIWPLSFYLTSTFCFLLQILNLPSINKTLVTITENYRQHSGFP